MDFMSAMEIAAASLRANRLRMNITSSNLANANTTRTAEGGPYRRKDAVFSAAPLPASFGRMLTDRLQQSLRTVEVAGIQTDPRPPRTVYDPGHPDADAKGIVKMPNVNMIEEMVDMITASRAYEAGVTTLGTIKAMADKALQIGK